MKLSAVFGKSKTGNPVSVEDRNRRGKGVQGAGQFDFERHASSLAAPPPPPPVTKEQWEDAGYDWADQDRLERVGLTPDEADEWRDKHFGVLDTIDWHRSGFALEEAEIWRRTRVKAGDAKKLKDAGLNVEEAFHWAKAISSGSKKSLVNLINRNETWASDEVLAWRGAEFSFEDAKAWCSSDFKLKDAVILRRNEVSTEEAPQWGEVTREATEIIQWKKAGCSPQEAMQWELLAIGRTPEKVNALKDAGITLEEAKKYNVAAQYSASEAIRLKKTGADLDEMIEQRERHSGRARPAPEPTLAQEPRRTSRPQRRTPITPIPPIRPR